MRHDFSLSGFNIRLRPVALEDAEFILRLRNLPHVLGTVGDTVPSVEDQRQWLQTYFGRERDYYFIIETTDGAPAGTIGLYDFQERSAEWGRWIVRPGVLAAVPSVLLIFRFAFEGLGLEAVRGSVVGTNAAVLSFHRRFGLRELGREHNARQIGGHNVDLVRLILERSRWPEVSRRMTPLAEVAARSIAADLA